MCAELCFEHSARDRGYQDWTRIGNFDLTYLFTVYTFLKKFNRNFFLTRSLKSKLVRQTFKPHH